MRRRLPVLLLILLLLTGSAAPEAEWEALFAQELLFLQQGLRQHGVEGVYTVYFAPPEPYPRGAFAQDLLIEGDAGLWWERFTCTFDPAQNWYNFTGSFEPILLSVPARLAYAEADQEKETFRAAAVCQTALSADLDLTTPLRFDVPPGPVTYNQRQEAKAWESELETWTYLYQDPRLDVTARITYPQLAPGALPQAEELNRRLKDALFYGYPYGQNSTWDPTELLYGQIQRTFAITRWDGRNLSLCVYEYNDFRQANHPNQWQSGLTLDVRTGQPLPPPT